MPRAAMLLAALLACRAASPPLEGRWSLRGEGVEGWLEAARGGCGSGVRVHLDGGTWGTDGPVAAETWVEAGAVWVAVPVQTGLGEAELPLRVQGAEWRLRLGAREGEFDRLLRASPLPPGAPLPVLAPEPAGLPEERRAWEDGVFLLQEGEGSTVGALRFRGDRPPLVAVFDERWLTPAPGEAARRDEGADIVLQFRAEPSLRGEDNSLRVHPLLREAVVPSGERPDPGDRRLRLVPGALDAASLDAAIAAARARADAREAARTGEVLAALAEEAARDGRCAPLDAQDPGWALLLAGYEVALRPDGGGCVVEVEPEVAQHTRRFRGSARGGARP